MTPWNTATCKTNQINMHYTRTGGNKPPLILLHGLTGNGACWTPVAKELENDYDIIMPDARDNQARHQTSLIPFQVLKPPNPDYKQLMKEINIPTLLVIAENGVVSKSAAEELQTLNPKLQVTMISGASHGLHYDEPEQFVDGVKSFLHTI